MLVALTLAFALTAPSPVSKPTLTERLLLRVAATIKHGESIETAKQKTANLGRPTITPDGRGARWEVVTRGKSETTTCRLDVWRSADNPERVDHVNVYRTVEAVDAWTGRVTVTRFQLLYELGFVETDRSTWSRSTILGKLRWGMGPADAAKVCPPAYAAVVLLTRSSDLGGSLLRNSPFHDRITELKCTYAPSELPRSGPLELVFLDDRLVEVIVPATRPTCESQEPRDCWANVGTWVDHARESLVRAYGSSFEPPLDVESEAIRTSIEAGGYVEFRNSIWSRPGTTVVLRDSGGSGWSYILYRDATRHDLEPIRKYAERRAVPKSDAVEAEPTPEPAPAGHAPPRAGVHAPAGEPSTAALMVQFGECVAAFKKQSPEVPEPGVKKLCACLTDVWWEQQQQSALDDRFDECARYAKKVQTEPQVTHSPFEKHAPGSEAVISIAGSCALSMKSQIPKSDDGDNFIGCACMVDMMRRHRSADITSVTPAEVDACLRSP